MTDTLTTCRRCGSDACYEVNHGNSMHWQCMDCGFYTNTYMLKNSEVIDHIKATSPELYKDLLYEDEDGFIWAPKVINIATLGILFVEGTSADNYQWCFAPEVIIPNDQQYRYPKKDSPGEFHTHRVDMNLKKLYGQLDFILAMQESGILFKELI